MAKKKQETYIQPKQNIKSPDEKINQLIHKKKEENIALKKLLIELDKTNK
ncbi:MAG: hypothetical protein HN704_16070 [Bacteroidetes bacterium]|jgi:hypothetical protein|nr:hypothetical protein [Bacteroidota bacterium]MBT6685725.1 hypothetical protein [Bacteroidota bacterium]MBT7143437.1 hypothetical protein [Bacteroidota bacterium]MBT7493114.1 hypothetical protein [Bacteroidota bacterium]